MEDDNRVKQDRPEEPRFLTFPCAPDSDPRLNKYSSVLTRDHDFPGAQAMLYGAGVPSQDAMKNWPQVGIASVWWEGNPCNNHLLDLGKAVKRAIESHNPSNSARGNGAMNDDIDGASNGINSASNTVNGSNGSTNGAAVSSTASSPSQPQGMLAWQYNTIGVSDAITMGGEGMRFSLQTRELIADSIETVTCAQFHDACIALPGCDKNMPGAVMGMARHNRPSIMIYGGTIRKGFSAVLGKEINISSCYEAHGAFLYDNLKSEKDPAKSKEEILTDIEQSACPGAGACGGMYTANTMATAIEAMGLSLPGSSSTPATSPAKMRECARAAEAIRVCMARRILPRDLLTRRAFENAMVMMMALGGSTNGVLHYIAMARTAGVELTLDDFQRTSDRVPFLANLAPSGRFYMADLFEVGGIPAVMKYLVARGLLYGDLMTVTGKTIAQNLEGYPSLPDGQEIIHSLEDPIKKTGHIEILRGNLAPAGAVAKITGKEGMSFTGKALVFDKEASLDAAINRGEIPRGENVVVVVRYEGPKGGPGMPEQLKASAAFMGAGLTNIALITDGRYSGASHGFIVGHICPEAFVGGPIAVVKTGDMITIDAEKNSLNMDVATDEIENRLKEWRPPARNVTRGVLAKYARLVGDASTGALTDEF